MTGPLTRILLGTTGTHRVVIPGKPRIVTPTVQTPGSAAGDATPHSRRGRTEGGRHAAAGRPKAPHEARQPPCAVTIPLTRTPPSGEALRKLPRLRPWASRRHPLRAALTDLRRWRVATQTFPACTPPPPAAGDGRGQDGRRRAGGDPGHPLGPLPNLFSRLGSRPPRREPRLPLARHRPWAGPP